MIIIYYYYHHHHIIMVLWWWWRLLSSPSPPLWSIVLFRTIPALYDPMYPSVSIIENVVIRDRALAETLMCTS